MPFDRLAEHKEREHLMTIAFTCFAGQNDGEFEMQCHPLFKKEQEERQRLISGGK